MVSSLYHLRASRFHLAIIDGRYCAIDVRNRSSRGEWCDNYFHPRKIFDIVGTREGSTDKTGDEIADVGYPRVIMGINYRCTIHDPKIHGGGSSAST